MKKMKFRILAVTLSVIMLIAMIPALTALADGEFTATLMGQLDADVNTDVDEWGIGDLPDATVTFNLGEEVTIAMEFSNPIKFTGNWTGISTDIPVDGDDEAEAVLGGITSFVVDGNELGSRYVPLIDRDDDGFLTIDIARQWGGDYDAYDLAGMDPFTTIEITFLLGAAVGFDEGFAPISGEIEPETIDFSATYNAWIGGTFLTDDGDFDWIPFEDQKAAFTIGTPFTAVLDFGGDTSTHGEADWGFITVVQTDIMVNAVLDAFIEDIKVDGNSISFNAANIEVGFDGGIRISLTNAWTDDPVVANVNMIGEFSKLEVTMVFTEFGGENPFGDAAPADSAPAPAPEPPPPLVIETPTEPESSGLPTWSIILIAVAGVAVIVVVVAIVAKSKKVEK